MDTIKLAKELRKGTTESEKFLWNYLSRRQMEGFKFRRQQPIGRYIVDFVNFEKKVIIELDGGQHAVNKEKDLRRDQWLQSQGFKILRFWDNELFTNIDGVLTTIREVLISPSPQPPPIKGGGDSFNFPPSRWGRDRVGVNRGLSSITILLLMVFLAITGRVVVSMVDAGQQSYSHHLESTQALYVAEAGLEWVSKSLTFVSGSASNAAGGRRLFFEVKNNSGGTITVTGLTASWSWSVAPADTTQFYEEVRIDGGAYNSNTVWNYTSAGSNRAGNGEAITFNTGPAVTLANGTTYEFALYEFKNDETGSSSIGNMQDSIVRVAFVFTPNSISVGRGSFTISVPSITSGSNALYASTAAIGTVSRKGQMASLIRPTFGATGTGLTYVTGSASTAGSQNENLSFRVENQTGTTISITSFTPVFSRTPESWYQTVIVAGTTVFDSTTPRNGTGDIVSFSAVSISDASNITIQLQKWRDVESGAGGDKQDVAGTTFQVTFSDGSVVEFTP